MQMPKFLLTLCLAVLLLPLGNTATWGGSVSPTAPIVVDGRVLFTIGPVSYFTGSERAKVVNKAIADLIKEEQLVQIQVTFIEPNGIIEATSPPRHLLTVTPADVISAKDTLGQAQVWSDRLETAIQKAQTQRLPGSLSRQFWLAGSVILLGIGVMWLIRSKLTKYAALLYLIPILWVGVSLYFLFPQVRSFSYLLLSIVPLAVFEFLTFIVVLAIYTWLINTYLQAWGQRLRKKKGWNHFSSQTLVILLQVWLNLLGLVIICQIGGLELGFIFIGTSLFSLAVSLVLQKNSHNFFSTWTLNIEKTAKVGDLVEIDNLIGIVEKIGLVSTQICTLEQISVTLPNSRFLEGKFINWTNRENSPIRIALPIYVSYKSDVPKVKAALLEAVKSYPDILVSPRPQVFFLEFGPEYFQFQLRFWIEAREKQFQIKSDLHYRILTNLRRYHIDLYQHSSRQDIETELIR